LISPARLALVSLCTGPIAQRTLKLTVPRYTLRLGDLAALFLARGFVCSHEAVRGREARCAPPLTARLRAKRRGQGGTRWHADATGVEVNGTWCSRYRAIDRQGNLREALLSKQRDMTAAQRFFARALDIVGHAPEPVTTDGHDAYPRASRATPGPGVQSLVSAHQLRGRLPHHTARCVPDQV